MLVSWFVESSHAKINVYDSKEQIDFLLWQGHGISLLSNSCLWFQNEKS